MEIDQNYLDSARYWGNSEPKNEKNQELKDFFDTLTEEEKEILEIEQYRPSKEEQKAIIDIDSDAELSAYYNWYDYRKI